MTDDDELVVDGVTYQRYFGDWYESAPGDRHTYAYDRQELLDEVLRLRVENESWRSLGTIRLNEVQRLRAENDRLQALIDAATPKEDDRG